MSTIGSERTRCLTRHMTWLVVAGVLFLPVHAVRSDLPGLQEWAEAVTHPQPDLARFAEVDWPVGSAGRPHLPLRRTSYLAPITVHAGPDVRMATVKKAVWVLEHAYALASAYHWRAPHYDGMAGGSIGFDLYLRSSSTGSDERSGRYVAYAQGEHPRWEAPTDATLSYAVVDVSARPFESCIVSAYGQSFGYAWDAAEAPVWRQALGEFLAWSATGRTCDEAPDSDGTYLPPLFSPRARPPGRGPGSGGLFLRLLARSDNEEQYFRLVRDLWRAGQQSSARSDGRLHGGPDLWQVVTARAEALGLSLERTLRELAVAHYVGYRSSDLGWMSVPTVLGGAKWGELPARWQSGPVEPTGAVFALTDVREAPDASQLRLWLRGELGVRYALSAVRLDAEGGEIGRVYGPVQDGPRAYLPVELSGEATYVLAVATNLSHRRPDADESDDNTRALQIIADRSLRDSATNR